MKLKTELVIVKDKFRYSPVVSGNYISYYENGQIEITGKTSIKEFDSTFYSYMDSVITYASQIGSTPLEVPFVGVYYDYVEGVEKLNTVSESRTEWYDVIVADIPIKITILSEEGPTDRYFNDPEPEYKINGKSGEWIHYFENGKICYKISYLNDIKNGHWISYLENGQVIDSRSYKNDLLDGEIIGYDWKGKEICRGNFINGTGSFVSYYSGGQIQHKGNYVNGLKEGEWILSYGQGQLPHFDKGTFINGLKEGEWTITYLREPSNIRKIKYIRGVPQN